MTSRPVVVVLGASEEDPPPGIEAAGAHVDLRFAVDGRVLTDLLVIADGLFFWRAERRWLEDAWPHANRLRWVQSASDGVDGLLFPSLLEGGVEVTNSRGVFEEPIAEWVTGVMLAFATRILEQRDAQLLGEWAPRETERLEGTRLVVVGPGPIGRAVARRAHGLGMQVSAAGSTARGDDQFGTVVDTSDLGAFDAMLASADWVLDALPATDRTRRLFDAARFAAMPARARFINVGRGATVDEDALVESLRRGTIAGAALDVFDVEPLPSDNPLWSMRNVLLSPHMCGDVAGWEDEVVSIFVDNAARFARGEPLRNAVDTAVGYGVG